MPKLIVVNRGGDEQKIDSECGRSVMELIQHAGIEEVFAICGGCCSCATCHVYVDPAFTHRMPTMSDEEEELLALSGHRRENSRLACQIPFRAELDGLKVRIADEG